MAVDTSVIGKPTGAWRVVLDRAVLANFAKAVCDPSRVYQRDDAVSAAGLAAVPAPPTFTFAAPYWSAFRPDDQPTNPTARQGNRRPVLGFGHFIGRRRDGEGTWGITQRKKSEKNKQPSCAHTSCLLRV